MCLDQVFQNYPREVEERREDRAKRVVVGMFLSLSAFAVGVAALALAAVSFLVDLEVPGWLLVLGFSEVGVGIAFSLYVLRGGE